MREVISPFPHFCSTVCFFTFTRNISFSNSMLFSLSECLASGCLRQILQQKKLILCAGRWREPQQGARK